MKYLYKNVAKCFSKSLVDAMELACERLHRKLNGLNLVEIQISEYNQKYFGGQLTNFESVLQTYAYLLILGVHNSQKNIQELCVVEYGAGVGVISLLCKELGIGTVLYNDIYDVSKNDAIKISNKVGLIAEHYVLGDIDELQQYCKSKNVQPDIVISFDVIEHIYDVEGFVSILSELSDRSFNVVFGSGANANNPILNWRYSKAQRAFELHDRKPVWGQKNRDSIKSYLSIRREIIKKKAPYLTLNQVEKFAKQTRGLVKQDIEKLLDRHSVLDDTIYQPAHPTNTCDPMTGNWAEHLMNTNWLCKVFRENNFYSKTIHGYWGCSNNKLKRVVFSLLNYLIKISGKKSLVFSPYYVILGSRNK